MLHWLVVLLLAAGVSCYQYHYPTVSFLESLCNRVHSNALDASAGGVLLLSKELFYPKQWSCNATLLAAKGSKIAAHLLVMDVAMREGKCDDGEVLLRDGDSYPHTRVLNADCKCGTTKPSKGFLSHDERMTVQFEGGSAQRRAGFVLSYAVVHEGDCSSPARFLCGNKHCISRTLLCDFYDHCGDNSDESPALCGGAPPRIGLLWTTSLLLLIANALADR